ncbi:MAG TPA: hypothetical protein VD927_08940 [Chryseosolibacter sp.]|nr:hypothetical protein [Chryseosolibacter sp.]
MKILVAAVVCFVATFQSYAQQNPEKIFYMEKMEKYARMKNTGKTLTVGGGVLFVVGMVIASNSSTTTHYNGYTTQTSTQGNPEAAFLCILLGSGGLGAGIPLWIVGNHAHDKYKGKLAGVSLNLKIQNDNYARGLGLAVRF